MKQLKLDHEQIGIFCRALGQMYHAGICAADALTLMAEDEESRPEKALLQNMSAMADKGEPLDRILRRSGAFPGYLCELVLVGETVGGMESTLFALADYYDGRARLQRQVKQTLLYPAVLLAVLLAVILVLLVWVLPLFDDVYARLGSSLTGLAGGLLALGGTLKNAMPLLAALLALIGGVAAAAAVLPGFRSCFAAAWSRWWGDRGIGRRMHTARFLQALAMGLSGGLPDGEAVELAGNLAGDSDDFRRRCSECLHRIGDGVALSCALRETELLTKAESRLLESGLRAGSGAQAMEKIAAMALENSEYELECIAGRIEPLAVVAMSVLVGGILLSVMLPLMHIMTAIG